METYKIDTDSWLYKFCREIVGVPYRVNNICDYRRIVIKAFFVATLGTLLACLVVWLFSTILVHMVLAAIFAFFYGASMFTPPAIAGYIMSTVGLLCVGFCYGFNKVRDKVSEATTRKQPNIVVQSYLNWKEKYCTKVEFIGSDAEYHKRDNW